MKQKTKTKTTEGGRARLIDVAQAAGVSRQTAGAVLLGGRTNTRAGEETAARIRAVAAELNYQPNQAARTLKGVRSPLVGVLNRVRTDDDPSHTLITRRLVEEIAATGLVASLAIKVEGGRSHVDLVEELARIGASGLIVLDHEVLRDRKTVRRLLGLCPRSVFYLGGCEPTAEVRHWVDVDREEATRMAVAHLVARGRRRIGVFVSRDEARRRQDQARGTRMAGLERGLREAHLTLDPALIHVADFNIADAVTQAGRLSRETERAVETLAVKRKVDAIISLTIEPFATVALAQRLLASGLRVPHDVAVITVRDYSIYRVLSPSITTVKLHHDLVAAPLAAMLAKLVADEDPGPGRFIQPELIMREST